MKIFVDTSDVLVTSKELKRNRDLAIKKIQGQMERAVNVVENNVLDLTPVNVGKLKQSIGVARVGQLTWIIGTPLKYADPVEVGRGAGKMPPVGSNDFGSLELWVRRKLGVPADKSRGVAFAVAISIAKRGTKGAFMFEDGYKNSQPKITQLLGAIEVQVAKTLEA